MRHRLWATMHILVVAVYLALSVIPATAGRSFDGYEFKALWVIAGWFGVGLCAMAVADDIRRGWRWRVLAGMWAATYIFVRALYVEWQFGDLAPWSSFALSVALAVNIAWSWGRPPVVQGHIVFKDP